MKQFVNADAGKVSAETAYRRAFQRLKSGKTIIVTPGSPVSQNNVAREAGKDPTALKTHRFPTLIEEIKAHIEITGLSNATDKAIRKERQVAKRTAKERFRDAVEQRDAMSSMLLAATKEINALRAEIKALRENQAHSHATEPTSIKRKKKSVDAP